MEDWSKIEDWNEVKGIATLASDILVQVGLKLSVETPPVISPESNEHLSALRFRMSLDQAEGLVKSLQHAIRIVQQKKGLL